MKIYSISEARKILGELINQVKYQRKTIALGRHGKAEAIIVAFAQEEEDELPITEMNASSESFAFLNEEPNSYSYSDLKKKYV